MTSARDAFLERVRQALRDHRKPAEGEGLPARGTVGYQGAGDDPLQHFCTALAAAGGKPHIAASLPAAVDKVLAIIRARAARKAILGKGDFLDRLGLRAVLASAGVEVLAVDELHTGECKDLLFAADIGIGGVDALVAETGSVALLARPGEPRSLSLLPPAHIAIAHRSQIIPDLFDLFARFPPEAGAPRLPSCLTLITGPSKTGDIELRLVTGVHGPGEIHVVVVADG